MQESLGNLKDRSQLLSLPLFCLVLALLPRRQLDPSLPSILLCALSVLLCALGLFLAYDLDCQKGESVFPALDGDLSDT